MADSSEAHHHPVNQNDEVRLNLTRTELQAMLNTAINNVVDRVLRDHKRKGDDTPIQGRKKGKTGSNHNPSKPKGAKPKCNNCRKQHSGKCTIDPRANLCGICKTKGHKTLDCKKVEDATCHGCGEKGHISTNCPKAAREGAAKYGKYLKDKQQSGEKPKCKTCKKQHFGKCRYGSNSHTQSRTFACGICKSKGHKTLDCKKMEDATCYGCNERGHIKTNCPKYAKKLEEVKKTKTENSQMDTQEAIQDDKVTTGTFYINNAHVRVLFNSGSDKSLIDNRYCKSLNLPDKTLSVKYEVKLADSTSETNSAILDGCFISIKNYPSPLSLFR